MKEEQIILEQLKGLKKDINSVWRFQEYMPFIQGHENLKLKNNFYTIMKILCKKGYLIEEKEFGDIKLYRLTQKGFNKIYR